MRHRVTQHLIRIQAVLHSGNIFKLYATLDTLKIEAEWKSKQQSILQAKCFKTL